MYVKLEPANDCKSNPPNPPKLEIAAVLFSSRPRVEAFLKHVRTEMDLLWPAPKDKK